MSILRRYIIRCVVLPTFQNMNNLTDSLHVKVLQVVQHLGIGKHEDCMNIHILIQNKINPFYMI